MLLMISMVKALLVQKTSQVEFRTKKVTRKNDEKRFAKWKGYNNTVNNCINIKYII